ncbi:short-chain dehydrogenase/reductase SDR [Candidatus Vecturithrix granuli]|uniref:Short-chain dehydrogenase/reductase SDR n=1 Tax=Vecturithrix granuli TaxID=1499967 RepID=A0A081BYY0_VECG1|nr:short-chain dehydrogenase/reductase SDR [Candidatus Vecturithrix granuli]
MKRVALITGGSRGIGFGIARCLAREGLDLAVCGTRSEEHVTEALDILRNLGSEVLYVQADVSEKAMRSAMLQAIRERFGRLHVLVNNAGVAPLERKDVLEATEESFERLIKINLQGPHFLCQEAANWMIIQKKAQPDFQGCIVNISSISSTVASVNRAEYCISKAGLSMSTKVWAVRLAEFGIPVFEVQPGVIQTDMTSAPAVKARYEQLFAEGLTLQPRWGQPEDIGKAVAMLVRGDLPYSTGQVISVDGGMRVERL